MKKIIKLAGVLLSLVPFNSFGQQWSGNNNTTGNIQRSGSIGIGNNPFIPSANLEINSNGNGWMEKIKGTATNSGNYIGIQILSGYPGDAGKWVGIAGVAEDLHSNNTGLALYTNQTERLRIKGNGFVGIGTNNPLVNLHLLNGSNPTFLQLGFGGAAEYYTGGEMSGIIFTKHYDLIQTAKIYTHATWNKNGYYGSELRFAVGQDNIGLRDHLIIKQDGKVEIGGEPSNTTDYRLAVKGKVYCQEVNVTPTNEWADYVFKKDYKLSSLEEVEKHIKEKGHLKDVPSAEEVTKAGYKVGEMDAALLQKIEELTLYVIAQEKENKEQRRQLKEQTSKLEEQASELKALKSLLNK